MISNDRVNKRIKGEESGERERERERIGFIRSVMPPRISIVNARIRGRLSVQFVGKRIKD